MKIKVSELKKLPEREWGIKSTYDSLIVINSGKKHGSGYALMCVVGCVDFEPVEIAAYCDDIHWDFNNLKFRNDMYYPSGAIHFWSNEAKFEVGLSLSTTDIKLQPQKCNN